MTSALSALENGARTISVERSTFEERGGNSRWTDANLLLKAGQEEFEWDQFFWDGHGAHYAFHTEPYFLQETAKHTYDEWDALVKTAPFLDPEVLGAFADGMVPTMNWLRELGVTFVMDGKYFPLIFKAPATLNPYITGGGLEVIEKLTPRIQARGGEFLCETTATGLITDDMGRVCGLKATGRNNEPIEIRAKAVILACGGFEGNPQMMAQYIPNARYLKPIARGGYYNRGEGLRMALDLNAAPAGDWTGMHIEEVDPRSELPEALVGIWPYGIVVNRDGKRFVDESPADFAARPPEEFGQAVLAQEGGIGYVIYDDQLVSGPHQEWRRAIRSDVKPWQADSLEELARLIGVPAAQLVQTVKQYNAACTRSNEVDFAFFDPDTFSFGRIGTEGLDPPKGNYARRIEKGPFYCYPVTCGIVFTYGGLRVTPDAQVVNHSGETIPGLYAAGETVGIQYRRYVGATSVLRGLIFGRIAGSHAAGSCQPG